MSVMAMGFLFVALGVAALLRPVQINDVHTAMIRVVDSGHAAPSLRSTKLIGIMFVVLGGFFVVFGWGGTA